MYLRDGSTLTIVRAATPKKRIKLNDNNKNSNNKKKNSSSSSSSSSSSYSNHTEMRNSRFFYNLLTVPRTVSNTYAHVARAQS